MGSIPSERRHFKADSVCIIGAGPSGLAAAKYLLAEKKAFSRIVIYEQRAETGGLWNYVPLRRNSKEKKVVVEGDGGVDVNVRVPVPVPQTSPDAGFAEAIWGENDEEPKFVSPVYERLETNIPRGLMGFSDLDWKENRQLFPKHEDVLEYLREYGEEVVHLVKFKTQVVDVKLWEEEEGGGEKWVVKTRPVVRQVSSAAAQLVEKEEENEKEEIFDAVICANGHYEVPYIPSVPGISAWNEAYPNTISHSKFYRTPEEFAGRKVIVVGNSASGIDISAQIEPFCSAPLIISQKSESYLNVESSSKKPNQITKPEITSYAPHPNRTITFSDNTTESHIDAILYCTGYFYSYPFLHSLSPPITTSGERVENTYQHMFYTPHPTLSFLVLNQKVIPFPLAEAQSAVIARVLSGRILLPSTQEMRSWERAVEKDMGTGRSFHVLKFPKDGVYMNFLSAWATSVDHRHDQPSSSSSSSSCSSSSPSSSSSSSSDKDDKDGEVVTGKTPPQWGEKEFRTREKFPHIKSAFNALGEGRHQVRSLEELGVEL